MNSKGRVYKAHIPTKRLYEIHKMINELPDSDNPIHKRNKHILQLVFCEGINPCEIARMRIIFSNQNKPMSKRRIQQIVTDYVPDYYQCRKKPESKIKKLRAEQTQIKKRIFAEICHKCGKYSENLELDHILPICFGGDNCTENLQFLCHECHKAKTDYETKIRLKAVNSNG